MTSFIPLIYMSIFMLLPHCINYCCFVISFEIGKCESTFSPPPKIILVILSPLSFLVNFRISLSFSTKPPGIPIGIALNLCISIRNIAILILSLPIHKHGASFHLLKSSLLSFNNIL